MESKESSVPEPVETPEQLEARHEMTQSIYERDMAYFRLLDDQRRRAGQIWIGGI